MQCLNCGGPLIMRGVRIYPLNENGVYDPSTPDSGEVREVMCTICLAGHLYEEIHQSEAGNTIALVANSDPKPYTTVALGFRGGVVDDIGAETFVGLIIIDEDKEQVGRFNATPKAGDTWFERALSLNNSIKKGEWQASFAEESE